jgi:hypothetical protein
MTTAQVSVAHGPKSAADAGVGHGEAGTGVLILTLDLFSAAIA